MQESPKKTGQNQQQEKRPNFYAKYAGMGIQMAAIILLLTFAGIKLDAYLNTSPIFTIVLSLVSVMVAMYMAVRDLLKK